MNIQSNYPSLYQINTRVWLTDLTQDLGRRATLDDIPDSELDRLAKLGFTWLWFLSVWTTGKLARKVSIENPEWHKDYEATLSDLKEEDIGGSGFAIADYHVHPDLGGDEALRRLHTRLKKRKLKLMLDFVPNHMGPDHPWVESNPEYFVSGTEADINAVPQNYQRIKSKKGDLILAYGRDPSYFGWPDTVQLDFSNSDTIEAMQNELIRISEQCDGVRCDMAMLILPDVFNRTWGRKALSFWPETIKGIQRKNPEFVLLAEVYWDMEWDLQQLGFNYAYDKRLYDRLEEGDTKQIREHFYAGLDYQDKLARFLENHDETRAAVAFGHDKQMAAAIITFLSPGLRFFFQGQLEGRKKRITPHLIRAPHEELNKNIQNFYFQLLTILKKPIFQIGTWQLAACLPAWEGNFSWDSFVVFTWEKSKDERALVAVNYSPYQSQCLVKMAFSDLGNKLFRFKDLMSNERYDRKGNELLNKGIFLDMPAWGFNVFEITEI